MMRKAAVAAHGPAQTTAPRRKPLARLLRRAHSNLALVVVLIVGALAGSAALLALRTEMTRSLELVARTTAYAVEPAVLFRHRQAALDVLQPLARSEHLAAIELVLPDGSVLAAVQRPPQHWLDAAVQALVGRLFDLHASTVLPAEGPTQALLRLQSDGREVRRLLFWYAIGIAAAMLASAVAVLVLSARTEAGLAREIDALARFTRAVRDERAFERRAPAATIAEIGALGDDFDALLAEVRQHEGELLERHARLRSSNEALSHQAAHDPLTGLPNRARFIGQLERAIDDARARQRRIAVLFIDADGFKAVNDNFGHDVGDRLLIELSQRLRGALREADCVGRLGGDEFAVLLTPLGSDDDRLLVQRKIERAILAPFDVDATRVIQPRASIGHATFPDDGDSAQALLRFADQAMYGSKRERRAHREQQ